MTSVIGGIEMEETVHVRALDVRGRGLPDGAVLVKVAWDDGPARGEAAIELDEIGVGLLIQALTRTLEESRMAYRMTRVSPPNVAPGTSPRPDGGFDSK